MKKNNNVSYLVVATDVLSLPVAEYDSIKEVARFLDVPLRTAENSIYLGCKTKGFRVLRIILD